MSCDWLIPLSCFELAVAYSRPLSWRIFAIAATSLGDVPVPLNSSIEASGFDSDCAQPASESPVSESPTSVSHAKHLTSGSVLTLMPTMRRPRMHVFVVKVSLSQFNCKTAMPVFSQNG